MVEFAKIIGEGEARSCYLNLSDCKGEQYGDKFPEHKTPLWIITDDRWYKASKHHRCQIWGSLRNWYDAENICPGDRVHIKYNPIVWNICNCAFIEISIINN